jgi:uncharacterized protein YcbX
MVELTNEQTQIIALVAVGISMVTMYIIFKLRRQKRSGGRTTYEDEEEISSPPRVQRHDSIADVVELLVYPIKSCAGISLDRVMLTRTGFRGDRMWMVVEPRKGSSRKNDENNDNDDDDIEENQENQQNQDTPRTSPRGWTPKYQFLTQRECPRLALIQPRIQSSNTFALGEEPRHSGTQLLHGMKSVTLSGPGKSDLICPVVRSFDNHAVMCDVSLWEPGSDDDANAVVDQGDEAAKWLSHFLKRPNLRLVFRDSTCTRVVNQKYRAKNQPSQVSFADGMQYLITSRTSLAQLNQKVALNYLPGSNGSEEAPILTMDRFRPNIVVNR